MPSTSRGIGYEIFRNVVISLVTLYKVNVEEGKEPTVTEFLERSGVVRTVFFNHLKQNLQKAEWVEFKVNKDRTITMRLTEKGKKVAEAFISIINILKEADVA